METNNLINIPLEFKVACTLTKETIQQVLQLFIDHVSLYDCISPYYSQGFSEASRTMTIYANTKPKRPDSYEIFNIDTEAATKLIAKLTKLGLRKTGIVQKTRAATLPHINKLFAIMDRNHTPSQTIYLDENTPLHLGKSFCILCEVKDSSPKEFLEYFMNNISMAAAHAHASLNIEHSNMAFDFFMLIVKGFARNTSEERSDLTDIELDFYDRMHQLHLELHIYQNLEKRTEIIKDFYHNHYLHLIQTSI